MSDLIPESTLQQKAFFKGRKMETGPLYYYLNPYVKIDEENSKDKGVIFESEEPGNYAEGRDCYIDQYGLSMSPPTGLIPRVEVSKKHLGFIAGNPYVSNIMISLNAAERLVKKGLTAQDLYNVGDVITTSTIHDSILSTYTIENEMDIVKRFNPKWHIPCDIPVYWEDSNEGRSRFIEYFIEDTFSFIDGIRGTGTKVLPLIKGVYEKEWIQSTSPFNDVGITGFAFYGKQYFGNGNGRNERNMINDIRKIITYCDVEYMMIVGYQSNRFISEFPPEVKGFAGERWLWESDLNNLSRIEAVEKYESWRNSFFLIKNGRQSTLKKYPSYSKKEAV